MNTQKNDYKNYINDSFDLDGLELPESSTPKERTIKFLELINGRHNKYNVLDNTIRHLRGMGEYLDIPLTWHDILKQAKSFGLTDQMMNNSRFSKAKNKELALESVEALICENYFEMLSRYIHQMAR